MFPNVFSLFTLKMSCMWSQSHFTLPAARTGWAIMRSSECVGWAMMQTRLVETTGVKCWHILENPSPTGILSSRWGDSAAAGWDLCLCTHARTDLNRFLLRGRHNLLPALSNLSGRSSSFSPRAKNTGAKPQTQPCFLVVCSSQIPVSRAGRPRSWGVYGVTHSISFVCSRTA